MSGSSAGGPTEVCRSSVDAGDIVNVESVDRETAVPTSNRAFGGFDSTTARGAAPRGLVSLMRPSRRTE